jgi:hypothetical protein
MSSHPAHIRIVKAHLSPPLCKSETPGGCFGNWTGNCSRRGRHGRAETDYSNAPGPDATPGLPAVVYGRGSRHSLISGFDYPRSHLLCDRWHYPRSRVLLTRHLRRWYVLLALSSGPQPPEGRKQLSLVGQFVPWGRESAEPLGAVSGREAARHGASGHRGSWAFWECQNGRAVL